MDEMVGAGRIEWRPVADLVPYARNARTHSESQVAVLAASIGRYGFNNPVLVDQDGGIIAGHGRVLAAKRLGLDVVPVVPLAHLSADEKRAYILADNKTAELAGWDKVLLAEELRDLDGLDFDLVGLGWSDKELDKLLGDVSRNAASDDGGKDLDAAPEAASDPTTRKGDLWVMGDHLVLCGDSASDRDAARVLAGGRADVLLSDPPYCSGGFQESGRSAGGIGRRAAGATGIKIANDALSTRGYQALIGNVLRNFPARVAHVFTDWRMWSYLFDVMESAGYNVKSMVVWDKGSAGLGNGWRAQHELVMCGVGGAGYKFDVKAGSGNVLKCKRTRNELHPTQKPVELMEQILDVVPDCHVVAEPFGGSGSTLIACETRGRAARVIELEPKFVDVIVRRWQDLTGQPAILEATGQSFGDVERERRDKAA
jgi:DNA modification methylase